MSDGQHSAGGDAAKDGGPSPVWLSLNATDDESDLLVRLCDLEPRDREAKRELWWDLVYPGAVSVLAGPPSVGKTTFMRRIVATIVPGGGVEFLGWPGPSSPVEALVIDYETPACGHYDGWHDAFAGDSEANRRVWLCAGESAINLETVEHFVLDGGIGLVVIDTLSAAFNFKEINSNSETEEAMKKLRRLARSTDAAVLILAHCPKSRIDLIGAQAQKAAADVVKFYEPVGTNTEGADLYRISGHAAGGARGKSRFGEILAITFQRSGAGHFDLAGGSFDSEMTKASVSTVAAFLRDKGAAGATTSEIVAGTVIGSRTTVLNALRDLRLEGCVLVNGKGRATRHCYVEEQS